MRTAGRQKTKKPPRQLQFKKVSGWGGKRTGAGRKNRSGQVSHAARAKINGKKPIHITKRLRSGVPTLRQQTLLKAFRVSAHHARSRGLRVVHFSLQGNHMHIFAEAESNQALANGMRSLAGRFGKLIRRHGRLTKGPVFHGRYHMQVLETPTQTKRALEYVLLNSAKHQKLIEHLDPYSSAASFQDWQRLLGRRFTSLIRSQWEGLQDCAKENRRLALLPHAAKGEYVGLSSPQTWLAKVGWQRGVRDLGPPAQLPSPAGLRARNKMKGVKRTER